MALERHLRANGAPVAQRRWGGGGVLVTLSGLDGSGKSTQAAALASSLDALGHSVEVVWTNLGATRLLAAVAAPARAVLRAAGRGPAAPRPAHDQAPRPHPATRQPRCGVGAEHWARPGPPSWPPPTRSVKCAPPGPPRTGASRRVRPLDAGLACAPTLCLQRWATLRPRSDDPSERHAATTACLPPRRGTRGGVSAQAGVHPRAGAPGRKSAGRENDRPPRLNPSRRQGHVAADALDAGAAHKPIAALAASTAHTSIVER